LTSALAGGEGRAIAQAISRWLPTAAARVRTQVWSCGICGGQSAAGYIFPEHFGSSASLHSTNCSTIIIIIIIIIDLWDW
jgi:hypothetical protein